MNATPWLRRMLAVASMLAVGALLVRATTRFEWSYDTLWYHIGFAATRLNIPISYELSTHLESMFDGSPPLFDWAQGGLWALTGSVTMVQSAGALALLVFVLYCHRVLRAPCWLTVPISLSAPLVLIHASTGYADLFANAWLAMGASSLLSLLIYPDRAGRASALGALFGLTAACWSKYTVAFVAIPLLLLAVPVLHRAARSGRISSRLASTALLAAAVIASLPYVRNLLLFGNPVWPYRVPVIGDLFPAANDIVKAGVEGQRPSALSGAPQWEVFVRSFLEIGQPTAYADRARWTLDQWAAGSAGHRMGGFWDLGVIVFLFLMLVLLVGLRGRAGAVAAAGSMGVLGFVALLPQSNELRYFMFIPLVWAATIGMLYPEFHLRRPQMAKPVLLMVLLLFAYAANENVGYYYPSPRTWTEEATRFRRAQWWPFLNRDDRYCVAGDQGRALFLSGPTLSEFRVVNRNAPSECPAGSFLLTSNLLDGAPGPIGDELIVR